ncbi:hypothetical protein LTR17_022034 [Elasticomyces elasticus]|nr:hypothetical protein LTR17_022034 [Elasticomyces elasticus]
MITTVQIERDEAVMERDEAVMERDEAVMERDEAVMERDKAVTALKATEESLVSALATKNEVTEDLYEAQLQLQLAYDQLDS